MSTALVPLGGCPVCFAPVAGHSDRRYMLERVMLGFHWRADLLAPCIGSHSLARPWGDG